MIRYDAAPHHRWEKHVEGRQLKGVCDELLRNLDTEALFRYALFCFFLRLRVCGCMCLLCVCCLYLIGPVCRRCRHYRAFLPYPSPLSPLPSPLPLPPYTHKPYDRQWIKSVEEEHASTNSSTSTSKRDRLRHQHVLLIGRDRRGHPQLLVNHEPSQVTLAKEVRHLTWLGFRVPAAVRLLADRASERYPHALALQAALRAWAQVTAQGGVGGRRPEMEGLLAGHVQVGFGVGGYLRT